MKIWKADSTTDVLACAAMGMKFIEAAGMPETTIENARATCKALMENPNCFLWRSNHGVMACAIVPIYYNPNYRMATELFWWSEDRSGLLLLKEFEDWAASKKVDEICMSTLGAFSGTGIENLLEKRGYEPRDRIFRKALL